MTIIHDIVHLDAFRFENRQSLPYCSSVADVLCQVAISKTRKSGYSTGNWNQGSLEQKKARPTANGIVEHTYSQRNTRSPLIALALFMPELCCSVDGVIYAARQ